MSESYDWGWVDNGLEAAGWDMDAVAATYPADSYQEIREAFRAGWDARGKEQT